ncbi:class I SAM-dependent methyltransferase [Alicyclobacillus sp. SO9]|uniref:class I SAM-dependent methyltransferase n=1 Tax=Alicyclobacillus sp. SO9 TaxID=2665646 RepID=UPI0018E8FEE3|nr:class I SAM-dependent methyltransferase [Alicyclobacillus sp. SO9]QQE77396.1 class I SAM-dependent methyltransferase [Alicyclobacillus sp. SO9]
MKPVDFLGGLKSTMEFQVFIDPLLVNSQSESALGSVTDRAREMAQGLHETYGQMKALADLGELPYSLHIARLCLYETLLSTAMVAAHERTGQMVPSELDLQNASVHIKEMIEHVGIQVLYVTYYYVVGHDLLQPFAYHKEMTEYDFFIGVRHYPYPAENLDIILPIALYRRVLRLQHRDGERVLAITKSGTRVYSWAHQCLIDSNYIEKRIHLSYVYQFDAVKDWDELSHTVWPEMDQARTDYIKWLDLPSEQSMLEVACGTGALTFDAGLYQHAATRGHLVATDSSVGMLEQAQQKHRKYGAPITVSFELASVERLPFPDDTFDVCIGSFFLHFVNPHKAISEMMRVVRPGGIVSVFQGYDFDVNKPFFKDWFHPILELTGNLNANSSGHFNANNRTTYMPSAENIPAWFHEVGLEQVRLDLHSSPWVFDNPDVVVQHIVRGVSFFQKELHELPWDDRRAVIEELIQRGQDVRRKYPVGERMIELPGVMIQGAKPV